MSHSTLRFLLSLLLAAGLLGGFSSAPARAAATAVTFAPGPELVIYADPNPSTLFVAPRVLPGGMRRSALGDITVTFTPAGIDGCVAFPANAQAAFQYAADVWAALLELPVAVEISACWYPFASGNILGSAGPLLVNNFTGQPVANTYYPLALANNLAGFDLAAGSAEINAKFNSNFPAWYFGTDGSPAFASYDFVSVVMHEIGHGMGLSGRAAVSGASGSFNIPPAIYDRFTTDSGGTALLSYANPSGALAAALTSGAVYFGGANARQANGGSPVELYAPVSWAAGSSYSHLSELYNNTGNAMMTYSLANGEAIHDPGAVAMGILTDLGWTTLYPPAPPLSLSAAGVTQTRIDLAWSDRSFSETSFQIQRSENGGAWHYLSSVGANVTSYSDNGLSASVLYAYQVRAANSAFGSVYSNTASFTIAGPPPAPTLFTATASGEHAALLQWKDNSVNETGFKLERSANLGGSWAALQVTAPNVVSYSDSSLTKGATYQYRITALSGLGNSGTVTSLPITTWLQTHWLYLSAALR